MVIKCKNYVCEILSKFDSLLPERHTSNDSLSLSSGNFVESIHKRLICIDFFCLYTGLLQVLFWNLNNCKNE